MNKSSRYNQQQAEPKQYNSEVEELRIHQILETGHCNIGSYLSENNKEGFHARQNFSEEIYMYIWK